MNYQSLRDRMMLLAEERLKNRALHLADFRHELTGNSLSSVLGGTPWEARLMMLALTSIPGALSGPRALDAELLKMIDQWADDRTAAYIAPLPRLKDGGQSAQPSAEVRSPFEKTTARHRDLITATVRSLGYEHLALPNYKPGCADVVKQSVRGALVPIRLTASQFKKAWQELLDIDGLLRQ